MVQFSRGCENVVSLCFVGFLYGFHTSCALTGAKSNHQGTPEGRPHPHPDLERTDKSLPGRCTVKDTGETMVQQIQGR